MSDIIQLLPDAIANQIAAGEVIQRPASAVKELLENAIDAGATSIQLIVKDAGKALIQVIDNGYGMTETDARLCFERHATSKIKKAKDLFSINTLGFRGEALASIASIAQVVLKTRTKDQALGTRIIIEGSEIKAQEPCQCAIGTSFSMKNLFFNVPARRNFLKSRPVEMRHIVDEFQRLALANPKIFFSLHNNDVEIFHLPVSNLRKRIVNLFGHSFNDRLVPVEQEIDFLRIYGFIGKPEYARKTRGEQYFFVNERFIKSAYLNHAIVKAYSELIDEKSYPLYVLFIDIDPARIDVNVHPTKQEIKFDDEKVIYAFINATIKQALASNSVSPTLDFESDVNLAFMGNGNMFNHPSINLDKDLSGDPSKFVGDENTNKESGKSGKLGMNHSFMPPKPRVPKNWESLFETDDISDIKIDQPVIDIDNKENLNTTDRTITIKSDFSQPEEPEINALPLVEKGSGSSVSIYTQPYQIHQQYILSLIKSGFILTDQQLAHERILFEKYLHTNALTEKSTQRLLFPQTINLGGADAALLGDMLDDINALGYDIQSFGQNACVLHGVPSDVIHNTGDEQQVIENLLEQFKQNADKLRLDKRENLARSMARNNAIKRGKKMSPLEMRTLLDQLFACAAPFVAPNGKPTFIKYSLADLDKQFNR